MLAQESAVAEMRLLAVMLLNSRVWVLKSALELDYLDGICRCAFSVWICVVQHRKC